MPIQELQGGDLVNQGVDKLNESLGEIPVSWLLTPDGNLVITKHNGQTQTVAFKNYFALLTSVFSSLAVGMATAEAAGKVLLVDDENPAHFQAANRVLSALQVQNLLAGLPLIDTTGAVPGQMLLFEQTSEGLLLKPTNRQDLTSALSINPITAIMPVFLSGLVAYLTKAADAGADANPVFVGHAQDGTMVQYDQLPVKTTPTHVPVVEAKSFTDANQLTTIRDLAGKMALADFAAILKPYLNATTPSTSVTVVNPVTDKNVTADGAQTVDIPVTTFAGADTYFSTLQSGGTLPISFAVVGAYIRYTIPANFANQTVPIKLTGANQGSGKSADVNFNIIVARTVGVELPYIKAIYRIFNKDTGNLFYLVSSSFIGNDNSKLPVWRCKRASEANWRSDFGITFPTADANPPFSNPLTAAYPTFTYAILQEGSEATTDTVFQFKPYLTAPDSTIITLNYTQVNNLADFGTQVFPFGAPKFTSLYAKRIAGYTLLSFYANGSGELKITLASSGSTAAYLQTKVMTTADGPYPSPENFSGAAKYGALFGKSGEPPVVNGTYIATIADDIGNTASFAVNINDTGPVSTLIAPVDNPTNPTNPGGGDNTTPAAGDQSSYTTTSTFTA